MFARILFIFGVLLCGGAAYLGYQNRTTLGQLRQQDGDLQKDIKTISSESDAIAADLTSQYKKITETDANLGEEKARAESLTVDINRVTSELTALNTQVTDKQTQVDALQTELEKLPPGMSIETLNEDIARIKNEIGDLKTEAAKLTENIALKQTQGAGVQKQLSETNGRLQARKRLTANNALSASVTAVNTDYGFVVISAGSTRGLTPTTNLIVSRNGTAIAKVRPFDITASRSVCNILRGTTTEQSLIEPGDLVTLEKSATP